MHIQLCVRLEVLPPNRRIEVPERLTLNSASEHLISFNAKYPGLVLEFEDDARDSFDCYGVVFNTRCSQLRKKQDADAAAEEGAMCVSP